jgi:hypothetical protein
MIRREMISSLLDLLIDDLKQLDDSARSLGEGCWRRKLFAPILSQIVGRKVRSWHSLGVS